MINLLSWLLYVFCGAVGRTLKIEIVNPELIALVKQQGKGVIFAAWHQYTLPLFYFGKDQGICTLTALTPRGEILTRCVKRFGFKVARVPFRGGHRKAAMGIRKMLRLLAGEADGSVVVDGPAGPAYKIKPGIFYLAQKTGRVVIPIGVGVKSGIRLLWRWDKFIIPLPFSTVYLKAGEPIEIKVGHHAGAMKDKLAEELFRLTEEAKNYG